MATFNARLASYDFILYHSQVEEVTGHELEELHLDLNALAHRIGHVPCRTPKERYVKLCTAHYDIMSRFSCYFSSGVSRLCQAEISQRTAAYVKLVASMKVCLNSGTTL